MSSSKQIGRCLLELIDRRYSQSCLYFRPNFVNYCPSNLYSDSPPHPTFPCVKVQYIQTVCGWDGGWGGVLRCIGEHILQEFNTVYLTTFSTYKTVTVD